MKYKYRKVTPAIVEAMCDMKEQGKTYVEIGKFFEVTSNVVRYWTNEAMRERKKEKARKEAKERWLSLTKEERIEYRKKKARYFRERYANDKEFRERMREESKAQYQRRCLK